eukprot:8010244-Pyramimonas_sp.AAC.1
MDRLQLQDCGPRRSHLRSPMARPLQERKYYVTHAIKEQGAKVWRLLESGGCVYVCGSSGKMPQVRQSQQGTEHIPGV